jgi:hypothetical protein
MALGGGDSQSRLNSRDPTGSTRRKGGDSLGGNRHDHCSCLDGRLGRPLVISGLLAGSGLLGGSGLIRRTAGALVGCSRLRSDTAGLAESTSKATGEDEDDDDAEEALAFLRVSGRLGVNCA